MKSGVLKVGAFGNEGLDIYFGSRKGTKKVSHIEINPKVTFYIEDAGSAKGEFKYLSVVGEALAIKCEKGLENAIKVISTKFPRINEISQSEDFDQWIIYKIKTKSVKYYENTEAGPLEVTEEV